MLPWGAWMPGANKAADIKRFSPVMRMAAIVGLTLRGGIA